MAQELPEAEQTSLRVRTVSAEDSRFKSTSTAEYFRQRQLQVQARLAAAAAKMAEEEKKLVQSEVLRATLACQQAIDNGEKDSVYFYPSETLDEKLVKQLAAELRNPEHDLRVSVSSDPDEPVLVIAWNEAT